MKCIASNVNHTMEVEIDNEPTLTFDDIAVPTVDGNVAFIPSFHFWNRLLTKTDLKPLVGQWFDLESDEWKITDCILCVDGTIFFRNATKKVVE